MSDNTLNARLKIRNDEAENWTEANPVLLTGEIGYETDTGKLKIGDGTTDWENLPYKTIQTSELEDGSVTVNKLATNSVATAKIIDSAVTSSKIADNAVITATIADNAVTNAKITSVDTAKLYVASGDTWILNGGNAE